MPEPPTNPRPSFWFGDCLVINVDLLGQGEKLLKLDTMDATEDQREAIVKVLRETHSHVEEVRRWFVDMVDMISKPRLDVTALDPAVRDNFIAFRNGIKCRIKVFADSLVISAPLRAATDLEKAQSIEILWAMLHATAFMLLAGLPVGIPLRAGVDIGKGSELGEDEVYGPVNVRAYRLESKIAQYPRAAVGYGVVQYLDWFEQYVADSDIKRRAKDCRDLICLAPDDWVPMLHILSPAILELGPHAHKLPSVALDFIYRQIALHTAAGNDELALRYRRLRLYFECCGLPRLAG